MIRFVLLIPSSNDYWLEACPQISKIEHDAGQNEMLLAFLFASADCQIVPISLFETNLNRAKYIFILRLYVSPITIPAKFV